MGREGLLCGQAVSERVVRGVSGQVGGALEGGDEAFVPTPALSRAILAHNRDRTAGDPERADWSSAAADTLSA